MSDIVAAAVSALGERLAGGFASLAKFVIAGEGSIMLDSSGAHAGDEPADVTLPAEAETFQAILAGTLNPTAAFMTGKLSVDGDMGQAMQLGAALS